jgi:protease I
MKRFIILIVIIGTVFSIGIAQRRNEQNLQTIQLPAPATRGAVSVEMSIAKRRSVREFAKESLNNTQLGQLAWAGQGITDEVSGKRAAPSAGAIYPMKLYFATAQGLFVYDPLGHILQQLESRDLRSQLSESSMGQPCVLEAPCDIIIAGSINQIGKRYGRRARDFALLETGHIAENIHLQAVALGLASVPVGALESNNVKRICRMPRDLEPLYIIPVGYPLVKSDIETTSADEPVVEKPFLGARALLIIASNKFRDEELFETQKILNENQIETAIASTKVGKIEGMLGGNATAKYLISEVKVDDYDAVIFIGGIGAREYFDNETALNIARESYTKKKILAAICIAPTILGKAELLEDKRVTAYASEKVRLLKAKAKYTGSDIEKDGNIITASGPTASRQFAAAIVEALKSR